jgi:phosphoglycolate phosphatase-like HAD superfamily hydrolase
VKAILFDWDGTLADTLPALFAANVAVMAAFGLPFDDDLYRRHFAPDWRLMYERLGVPSDRLDEANALWVQAYAGGRESVLLDGAATSLERLAQAGFRLGLVTAGHREIVEPQLARLGLTSRFEVAVFGTDTVEQKPDPGPLRAALAAMSSLDGGPVAPAEAVYVGDTAEDMAMAVAADVHAVGIPSRIGSREALLAAGAEIVVESVSAWVDGLLAGPPRATGTGMAPSGPRVATR